MRQRVERSIVRRGCAPMITSALLALAGSARADQTLDKEMAELARQVQQILRDRKTSSIQVGDFVAKGNAARQGATGGQAITKTLIEQLEKLGTSVTRSSDLIVSGEFRDVTDRSTKSTALQVKAKIEDRQGETIVDLASRGVFDLTTIAALTGITIVVPPRADEAHREDSINRSLDSIQSPHLQGTSISARVGSPYSIEILVGPDPGDRTPDIQNYAPRAAAIDKDGLAFFKINRGEVYAVKVANRADTDVAVNLAIDGLGLFAFSENRNYDVVIVPRGHQGIIPGWHINNTRSDAFQVAEYARSAVAKLLPTSTAVGTISVSFKAAWPKDAPPPADEAGVKPGARDADATARGRPVDPKDTRYNEVIRNVGKLRESVSVHYSK